MQQFEIIIDKILEIQKQPYVNWISSLSRKNEVENLHEQLDKFGYEGPRPPKDWSHLDPSGKYCPRHMPEIMNSNGKCPKC